jgi:hypothetical protein
VYVRRSLAWWANLDNSALSLRRLAGNSGKSDCFSQESSLRAGKSVDSGPQKRSTESAVSAEMDWRLEGGFFTVRAEEHPGWKLRFVGRRGFMPECPVLSRGCFIGRGGRSGLVPGGFGAH